MQTYHSRETVKARKVTAKDGETVMTFNGAQQANKGDYVVHKENKGNDPVSGEPTSLVIVSVWTADQFNAAYKSGPGRGGGESQRTRKSAPKGRSSVSKTAPTRKSSASAADRVRASRK